MPAYTDTELQSIASWLKDGLSAARIAIRLSALRGSPASRNAVISIVHRNADLRAIGFANPRGRRPARHVTPARLAPPVWLPQRQYVPEFHGPDGEALKVPAPRPAAAVGRQPHVAAMRFVDCLFGRCRAPLDLTLEEDPENDAPGSRPGLDMLCCGLRTRPSKSYCAYHAARFRDDRRTALADAL